LPSATTIRGRLEPFRATVRVPNVVPSVIVSVAADALPGSGVKVTSMVQRVPTATTAGQLFVTA
jgi:hypothetical protein